MKVGVVMHILVIPALERLRQAGGLLFQDQPGLCSQTKSQKKKIKNQNQVWKAISNYALVY